MTSPLCPLCRVPFDPKKVERSSSVEKQLASFKAPCRGCSKKVGARHRFAVLSDHMCSAVFDWLQFPSCVCSQVTLVKMRSHIVSCSKVQEQIANCPKFVPVVPTSQPIPRYAGLGGPEQQRQRCCQNLHPSPIETIKKMKIVAERHSKVLQYTPFIAY